MLHQPLILSCDGHTLRFPTELSQLFPAPGECGFDRSIFTPVQTRREAAKLGWKRRGEMDICPRCVAAVDAQKGGDR